MKKLLCILLTLCLLTGCHGRQVLQAETETQTPRFSAAGCLRHRKAI